MIERSFQGLSVAIKTMRIVEELIEIWLNEVCDKCSQYKFCTRVYYNLYIQRSDSYSLGGCLVQRSPLQSDCLTIVLGQQLVGKQVSSWVKILHPNRHSVTNFIWPYLYQFFNNSHGLNSYRKPLKRPFNHYQSCLKCHDLAKRLSHYLIFFSFSFLLFSLSMDTRDKSDSQGSMGLQCKVRVRHLYKQCRKSNGNSIEFSLSNAEQRAVGLILAQSLAL